MSLISPSLALSATPRLAFSKLPLTIAAFCLLWSFAFVAGKTGVTYCPPLILLAARFLLAGILIVGIAALRGEGWSLTARDVAIFAVLGVANNALYLGLAYTGLQTVSAGLGGLIVSANPIFTAILAAIFLGEALTWRKVGGLLLGIAGVALIVWHRISVGTDSMYGIAFTLASLASIVAGTILFKALAPKGDLWLGNGIQNLAGGLAVTPFAVAFSSMHDIVPNMQLLGAFAFLVLGGSILAYLLWFHLLKTCGATVASAYHFLMPPLAMLFAWMVLGEHVAARDLLGIVPVALGIYLVTRSAAAPARRASWQYVEKVSTGVIPGHAKGANPESRSRIAVECRDSGSPLAQRPE
jgi:drug/metabolite transporter (DMT)-like permease